MDATESVVVDKFAGLNFGQACLMLFDECKSSAPQAEAFESTLKFIEQVHTTMGRPFSRDEYWNADTMRGTHEIFPSDLGHHLNIIPDEITPDFLRGLITQVTQLEVTNNEFRTRQQTIASSSRNTASRLGSVDPRSLERTVNAAPVYVAISDDSEEDDFL